MRGSSEELGSGRLEVGNYHVYVDTCEERTIQAKGRPVDLWTLGITVLAGDVEGQEGKQLKKQDYFSREVLKLAAACGLTNYVTGQPFTEADRKAIEEAAKRKEKVEFEFHPEDLIAGSFYVDVVMGKPDDDKTSKWYGQSFPELGKNIRSILDPSVAGLPKDPEIWAAVSGAAGGAGGGNANNGQPVAGGGGSLLD